MRRPVSRKPKASHAPARTREPLAEGLLTKRGREWNKMNDEQLVAYAKKFMKERGISYRGELKKADEGLYQTLQRRKLLDKVGFEKRYRNGSSLSDEQLVEHARQFMEENGISGRSELLKADGGLYKVLRVRKLLDNVFADIEKSKEKEEIQQIVAALEEFSSS